MAQTVNSQSADLSYQRIFALAWPASIASAVTPLLGAVDVWALAQSERPLEIAAVGLGGVIFSLAYWSFGFIRMSVAGLTAQAAGAGHETEARAALLRGAAIGAGIGLCLILVQWPLGQTAFKLLAVGSDASAQTFTAAETYYGIRIWGAPFALASYAAFGWMSARRRTDYLMAASLIITAINIVLDYWFVVGLGWGAAGVAAGTLIAEISGFLICLVFILLILRMEGGVKNHWRLGELLAPAMIRRTLSVNLNVFVRTILLAFCFSWFVQRSGAFGDLTLAANQALLQLFLFTGLALDGTAIAAETLVGQAVGARDKALGLSRYRIAVRRTFILAGFAAVLFTLFYGLAGEALIALLTPDGALRETALRYMPWVVVSPLFVVVGFQLDGIFIGATRMREMRDAMILSAAVFIGLSIYLEGALQNHGLWAAFSAYFVLRALSLGFFLPRIEKSFRV